MLSFYKTLTHFSHCCGGKDNGVKLCMPCRCYGVMVVMLDGGYALWCYKEDGVMVVGMSGYKKDGGYAR